MIAPLPSSVRDYLAEFQLAAISRTRDGRWVTVRDPGGMENAWWCAARSIGRVFKRVVDGEDPEAAAAALGVTLTNHATVLARAADAAGRIADGLTRAQAEGLLKDFNREYRIRRLAAAERGKRFMSYDQAMARLRRALAQAAAGHPAALMTCVFDG
jgi:hypothetical protein